eukprot:CFRG7840T1
MVVLKFTMLKGDANGRVVNVAEKRISIRRANPKNLPTERNLVFDSKVMSRHHAEVWLGPDGKTVYIQDVGSSNGTHINDVRLEPNEPQAIKDGDTVQFGEDFDRDCTCVVATLNIGENFHTDQNTLDKVQVAKETTKTLDQLCNIIVDIEEGARQIEDPQISDFQDVIRTQQETIAAQKKLLSTSNQDRITELEEAVRIQKKKNDEYKDRIEKLEKTINMQKRQIEEQKTERQHIVESHAQLQMENAQVKKDMKVFTNDEQSAKSQLETLNRIVAEQAEQLESLESAKAHIATLEARLVRQTQPIAQDQGSITPNIGTHKPTSELLCGDNHGNGVSDDEDTDRSVQKENNFTSESNHQQSFVWGASVRPNVLSSLVFGSSVPAKMFIHGNDGRAPG